MIGVKIMTSELDPNQKLLAYSPQPHTQEQLESEQSEINLLIQDQPPDDDVNGSNNPENCPTGQNQNEYQPPDDDVNGNSPQNCPVGQFSGEDQPLDVVKLYTDINLIKQSCIKEMKNLHIWMRYQIGHLILSFYKGKYGNNEMMQISKNTKIGVSALYKSVRLAKMFSESDVESLTKFGHVSYRLLVECLPMKDKEKIRNVFKNSKDAKGAQEIINEIKRLESAKNNTADSDTSSNDNKQQAASSPLPETKADEEPAETMQRLDKADGQKTTLQAPGLEDANEAPPPETKVNEESGDNKIIKNNKIGVPAPTEPDVPEQQTDEQRHDQADEAANTAHETVQEFSDVNDNDNLNFDFIDDTNETDEETYAETDGVEEDAAEEIYDTDEDAENDQNMELDKIVNDITNENIPLPPLQLLIGQGTNQVQLPNICEKMDKIGTELINASKNIPANGDLRKIIQNAMSELTVLLGQVTYENTSSFETTLS